MEAMGIISGLIVFSIILLSLFIFPLSHDASDHVAPDTANANPEQSLANDSFWIHMDPIDNVTVGDHLSLSGTTNLPQGGKLQIRIHPTSPDDQNNENSFQYPPAQIIELAQNHEDSKNWSAEIDPLNLQPNATSPYWVSVRAVNYPAASDEQPVFLIESLSIIPGTVYTYTGITPYRNISSVEIWIIGSSLIEVSTVPIDQHGRFTFSLDRKTTDDMGQKSQMYSLIFHYPASDDQYGLTYNRSLGELVEISGKSRLKTAQIRETGTSSVSKHVMDILTQYGGNDTCRQRDLVVTPARISIDPIGEITNSRNITITGTTNIPPGDYIVVEVYDNKYHSRVFWSLNGTIPGDFSQGKTVPVEKGLRGNNVWNLPVPIKGWRPGKYVVDAMAVYGTAQREATFNVTSAKDD